MLETQELQNMIDSPLISICDELEIEGLDDE